jgi:hypothetical protein
MNFNDYVQMLAADRSPAFTLALSVILHEATLDNLIDSGLETKALRGLGSLFLSASQCREKMETNKESVE